MAKRVSVIINNFNYGRFITQAIESVLAQTYRDIELIIVDDGSTDDSATIIGRYEGRASILLKANGGQASALNSGLKRVSGDLVLFLDSDDFLYPEAVAVAVRELPEGYSRTYFGLDVVDETGRPIHAKRMQLPFVGLDGCSLQAAASGHGFPSTPTSGNLFRVDAVRSVMPIPEDEYRICADAYLFIRTALFGPVRSIDQRLGAYRLHGANNFSYRAELLTNPRKLATHLDNYFKTSRLLREAYKLKGISHDERHFAFSFSALQLLCAAFQHHIDSPFLADLSRFSLTDQVKGYLCSGTDSFMKRIVRSVYLWSVIWSPMPIAGYLMALMEKWQRRN